MAEPYAAKTPGAFALRQSRVLRTIRAGKVARVLKLNTTDPKVAEIFASAMDVSSISETDGLSPNDNVTLLAQKLNINHALYVGHLPYLEKLVTYLVTGDENDNIIKFQNSAVICLEKSDSHFQLRWYLTPELTGE